MTTNPDVFNNTVSKTNEILKRIEADLHWENRRNQSYLALRAVLHALRDRLPVDDAVHFAAQLPLLLKGVYYDGWRPTEVPIRMSRDEFVQRIASEFKFDVEGGTERMITTVFNELFETVDPGEQAKIMAILPADIAALFY